MSAFFADFQVRSHCSHLRVKTDNHGDEFIKIAIFKVSSLVYAFVMLIVYGGKASAVYQYNNMKKLRKSSKHLVRLIFVSLK